MLFDKSVRELYRKYFVPIVAWTIFLCCMIWLRDAIYPLASALVLAYMLNPVVRKLTQLRIPRIVSVWIVYLSTLGILTAAVIEIVPRVTIEAFHFAENAPQYFTKTYREIRSRVNGSGVVHIVSERRFKRIAKSWMDRYVSESFSSVSESVDTISNQVSSTIWSIINISLFPIFFYYMLARFHRLKSEFLRLIPKSLHPASHYFLGVTNRVMGGYIRGQIMVCISLGMLYAAGLWMIGLTYGPSIGFIAGFLNLIPYLGFLTGMAVGLFMAFVTDGNLMMLVSVAAVFVTSQMIESFILTPKIVGSSVGLDPFVTLVALIVGGNAFGFIGMLLAIPV
ncbi:AI-2E family transporter, partial [bacterium]|nr:AI-2E family transporter [bacterium]